MRSYTLVTGGTGAIGREICANLIKTQNIIVCGSSAIKLEDCKGFLSNQPNEVQFLNCDLRSIEGISSALIKLLEKNISIDRYVHCAGVLNITPARLVTYQVAKDIFDINFFSAVEIISTLLKPRFNNSRLKRVLFISSIWSAFGGSRGHSIYSASKGALDAYMKSLSLEMAEFSTVNSLLLGAIETEMSKRSFENVKIAEAIRSSYPLGVGSPTDVANFVSFILSDDAKWLTGQEIILDGGRTNNAGNN